MIGTANARIDRDYAILPVAVDPGQHALITVTDNGSGASVAEAGRIFDPFFTTGKFGQGTGLGLSMVYGFFKQSQEHVKIHSGSRPAAAKVHLPRGTAADAQRLGKPCRRTDLMQKVRALLDRNAS